MSLRKFFVAEAPSLVRFLTMIYDLICGCYSMYYYVNKNYVVF